MPRTVQKLRVFVASPSDVGQERLRLEMVVRELNLSIGEEKQITVELIRWETNVAPGMGRPQEVVNQQIGEFDVFVGIMWKHFGTPTGVAGSGTQEEFHRAYESWKSTGSPRILFYFSQAPYALKSSYENEQVGKVIKFREDLQAKGLICDYDGPEDFERRVRVHLQSVIREILSDGAAPSEDMQSIPMPQPRPQHSPHHERVATALQALWDSVLLYRETWSRYIFIYTILLPEELNHVFTNPKSGYLIAGIDEQSFGRDLQLCTDKQREAETGRMYVGEELWSLYQVYGTFFGRQALKVMEGVKAGNLRAWDKDLGDGEDLWYVNLVRQVLPASSLDPILLDSASTQRHARRLGIPQRLLNAMEQEILSRIRKGLDL